MDVAEDRPSALLLALGCSRDVAEEALFIFVRCFIRFDGILKLRSDHVDGEMLKCSHIPGACCEGRLKASPDETPTYFGSHALNASRNMWPSRNYTIGRTMLSPKALRDASGLLI